MLRIVAAALLIAPLALELPTYESPAALVAWPEASRVHYVAHRGGNTFAPENTLASMGLAVAWGAGTVEVDVRRSADGTHWLMHDGELDRTTDGTGPIAEATDKRIRGLDAGSWFGPEYTGTRVPTLAEALDWARGRVDVYIDLKAGHLPTILAEVEAAGMRDHVFFWSGNDDLMRELRSLDAEIGLKVNVDSPEAVERAVRELQPTLVEMDHRSLSEATVEAARAAGLDLMVYTKKPDARLFARALALGVTHFNIDHPYLVAEVEEDLRSR